MVQYQDQLPDYNEIRVFGEVIGVSPVEVKQTKDGEFRVQNFTIKCVFAKKPFPINVSFQATSSKRHVWNKQTKQSEEAPGFLALWAEKNSTPKIGDIIKATLSVEGFCGKEGVMNIPKSTLKSIFWLSDNPSEGSFSKAQVRGWLADVEGKKLPQTTSQQSNDDEDSQF